MLYCTCKACQGHNELIFKVLYYATTLSSVSQKLVDFFAQLKNTSKHYALNYGVTGSLMCRGVTRGERRPQFPGRRMTAGEKSQQCPKSPNNVTSRLLSSIQFFNVTTNVTGYFIIYFQKTSGSKMGAQNLPLAPGAI